MEPIGIVEFKKEIKALARPRWLKRRLPQPYISSLFALEDEGPVCCRLLLPYHPEEWERKSRQEREILMEVARERMAGFGVATLAWPVFNGETSAQEWGMPVFTGYFFTAALSLMLAKKWLADHKVRRLYLAGYTPCIPEIIDLLSRWHCPVVWSSPAPAQSEVIMQKLFYERGCRAAITGFKPAVWETDDLVLSFNHFLSQQALASRAQIIDLSEEAQGFFPLLEQEISALGVDNRLGYLSPLMESFVNQGQVLSENPRDSIIRTLARGAEYGCWELILDNHPSSNYNSLKGLAGYLG